MCIMIETPDRSLKLEVVSSGELYFGALCSTPALTGNVGIECTG